MTAALNWYRAVPLDGVVGPAIGRIEVPTLYVWSSRDSALGRAAAQATGSWISAPYRFEVLDGVSHWIPETAAKALAGLIVAHANG